MKKIFLFGALAGILMFTSCQNETPYDTQSPDDAPRILVPYETESGSLSFSCDNPDTPLFDSVIVTPSRYTTVNWYVGGQFVWSGTKINMRFQAGKYDVLIEAVTQAGKRTERKGTLTVKPADADPYSGAPGVGRHVAPAADLVLEGSNLNKVEKVVLSKDIYGENELFAIVPSAKTATKLTLALPEMEDGSYYLRFLDADANVYGSDNIEVHHGPVVTNGYDAFIPNDANWEIEGINLDQVKSITIDDIAITAFTASATKIQLTAPDMPKNTTHILSMQDASGAQVLFATGNGLAEKVESLCTDQIKLWNGPVALDWDAELVKVTKEQMAVVAAGDSIFVYFDTPDAEYHAFRITTPWWGDPATLETDLVLQINEFDKQEQRPFTFVYDERCKGLVVERGAMSIVGFGVTINKITYKHVE